jgi:uncharacterized protein YjbJ (UPF0337 family)
MSKEGVEGATQKGVGAVKEAAGEAAGNEKLQAEGVADKVVGSGREAAGKAKDAVHKATRVFPKSAAADALGGRFD